MCARTRFATSDPLGIGGLLVATLAVARLLDGGELERTDLLEELLDAAASSLSALAGAGALAGPASERLAFRELGLAIGLHAIGRLAALARDGARSFRENRELLPRLAAVAGWLPLAHEIEAFWREPAHRRATSWMEHEDINSVMLATSLAPDGYLGELGR